MKRYPSGIVATCVIPWDERGSFVEEMFREQVRVLRENLTPFLYVFGTAGEGYAVNDAQFEQIARVFREETDRPGVHAMLGVISLSLSTIIQRIEKGRELGFREFQISLPCWGALTDREVDCFFRETCGRFPDCRFLHYNLMRTKKLLTGSDYARLSRAHPNLVAVKVGSGDAKFLEDLLVQAPALQFYLGEFGYPLMRDRHECGLLISLAATNFTMGHEFFAARGDRLRSMAEELRVTCDMLFRCVGDAGHMDGVYDKMFYKLHEPRFPLRLLPPYGSVPEETFQQFRSQLPPRWQPDPGLVGAASISQGTGSSEKSSKK